MKKGIIYTIIFTLFISFAFVFLLALTNELTKKRTEKNSETALYKAVLNAFNISYTDDEEAYTLFNSKITRNGKISPDLYIYKTDNTTQYAIIFTGMGLWGQIRGVLAVNEDVSRIEGIEIISHNETPGLGGRIDEKAYKDQWKNEKISPDGGVTGTRNNTYDYNHENGKIDGITGASRTSERMISIINSELSYLRTLLGGKS